MHKERQTPAFHHEEQLVELGFRSQGNRAMTMNSIRKLVLLLLFSALSACATFKPLPKEVVSQWKRVGVMSQTGDRIFRLHVAAGLFRDDVETLDVSSWKMDEAYDAQIADAVREVLQVEPVILAGRRTEFANVNDLDGPYAAPAFWGPNYSKIEAPTRKACEEESLDTILIAPRWQSEDLIGRTKAKIEGVGVYTRVGTSRAHVLSMLAFMNCKTGKPLHRFWMRNPPTNQRSALQQYLEGPPDRLPTEVLSSDLGVKPFASWNPAELEALREIVIRLPQPGWASTLREMVSR